jgi:hypothetical protein
VRVGWKKRNLVPAKKRMFRPAQSQPRRTADRRNRA